MLNSENRYLFKFAWKSIRRNAGRSFFIGFSVSLAVMITIWIVAFFDGLNSQIERAVVNTNIGFFQVQDPVYAKSTDASHPMPFTKEVSELWNQYPVTAISPELVLDGNISTPEGVAGLQVLGIEPEWHKKILPIYEKMQDGEFLINQDEGQVLIGKELADLFKFNVGDNLVLNFQDHTGDLRSEILLIKGIYHYNSKGFEKRFVYVNQKTWQKLFLNNDTGTILYNRIILMTPDLTAIDLLNQKAKSTGVELRSWKNLNPEMAVVLDFHDGMIKFFFVIIGITITMTIMTPVRMLWQERFKELKMMNVIGVSADKFWKIGFFEVIQMIFLSSCFSTLSMMIIIGIQSHTGVDFRFLNDGIAIERAGIKLPGIIYPQLSSTQILITFVFVMLILGISYFWSIHRTLKSLEVSA